MGLTWRRAWGPVVAALVLYACKSDDGPAPERAVVQTLPRCVSQADCVPGEECLDSICRQPYAGFDASIADPTLGCVPDCAPDQICLSGFCYASAAPIDAGSVAIDPCGGICLGTQTCNHATGQCDQAF